jgi:hypothetical protein
MSTPTMTRPPEQDAPTEPSRSATPAWIAAVLAVILIGAVAWFLYEPAADDAAFPSEIDALIDDYLGAWEAYDADGFLEATTLGMVLEEYYYEDGHDLEYPDNARVTIHIEEPSRERVIEFGFSDDHTWTNERIGDPIISGDSPWFVSQRENWTIHDEYGTELFEGMALYVVVSEDGELKVANHFWVGEPMLFTPLDG